LLRIEGCSDAGPYEGVDHTTKVTSAWREAQARAGPRARGSALPLQRCILRA